MLVLAEIVLVERVRHVEGRPRALHVQVERAGGAGVGIQTVEEGGAGPVIVQGVEFRRIEEPVGLHPADRQEVADRVRPAADVRFERRAAERAERAGDTSRSASAGRDRTW